MRTEVDIQVDSSEDEAAEVRLVGVMAHWESPPLPKRTAGSVDRPLAYKRLAVSNTIVSADPPSTDWGFCSGLNVDSCTDTDADVGADVNAHTNADTDADFEAGPNRVLFPQLDDLLNASHMLPAVDNAVKTEMGSDATVGVRLTHPTSIDAPVGVRLAQHPTSWSPLENAAASGLLSLSRQPGQILVNF